MLGSLTAFICALYNTIYVMLFYAHYRYADVAFLRRSTSTTCTPCPWCPWPGHRLAVSSLSASLLAHRRARTASAQEGIVSPLRGCCVRALPRASGVTARQRSVRPTAGRLAAPAKAIWQIIVSAIASRCAELDVLSANITDRLSIRTRTSAQSVRVTIDGLAATIATTCTGASAGSSARRGVVRREVRCPVAHDRVLVQEKIEASYSEGRSRNEVDEVVVGEIHCAPVQPQHVRYVPGSIAWEEMVQK